jgi:hypothetical protein
MPKKQHKHEHIAAKVRGASGQAGPPTLRGKDKHALVSAARLNASSHEHKAPTIRHRIGARAKAKGTTA